MTMLAAGTTFGRVVDTVGKTIEAIGIAVTVVVVVGALVLFAKSITHGDYEDAFTTVRRNVGQGVLLGLELLVAGDIGRTVAIDPTPTSIAVLGGIVLIRTFLSVTIDTEVNGRWPWKGGDTPRPANDRKPHPKVAAESSTNGQAENATPAR
jgi:uncharacterized membrane protein